MSIQPSSAELLSNQLLPKAAPKAASNKVDLSKYETLQDLLKDVPDFTIEYRNLANLKDKIERFYSHALQLLHNEKELVSSRLQKPNIVSCELNRLNKKYTCLNKTEAVCNRINKLAQTLFKEIKCPQLGDVKFDWSKIVLINAQKANDFGFSLIQLNLLMLIVNTSIKAHLTVPKEVFEGKNPISCKFKEWWDLASEVRNVGLNYAPYLFEWFHFKKLQK